MEYYLAIKKKDVPTHAVIWMSLENTMLAERIQLQKITYCVLPIYMKCPE